MHTHKGIRRAVAVSVAVASMTLSATSPAFAGDQRIVNKGIGFLAQIRSQARHMSCSGFRQQLKGQNITVPESRSDFEADIENNAQVRRDWINKQSGGMTAEQKAQLEDEIDKTRPVVLSRAEECGVFDLSRRENTTPQSQGTTTHVTVNQGATTSTPKKTTTSDDDDTPAAVRSTTTTTTGGATTTTTTTTTKSDVDRLNAIQKQLRAYNDSESKKTDAGAPHPAAAPAPKVTAAPAQPTTLLIPNPLNPARPFVLAIPRNLPANILATLARMLPPGWVLR